MSTTTDTTRPRRKYRIVKVVDLQPGDIVKASRRTITRVDTSGNTWEPFEGRPVTALYFKGNSNPHVWFNDQRLGIYR